MTMRTYSLAEVRRGTDWPPEARFTAVGVVGGGAYTQAEIRGTTGWSREARFTLVGPRGGQQRQRSATPNSRGLRAESLRRRRDALRQPRSARTGRFS